MIYIGTKNKDITYLLTYIVYNKGVSSQFVIHKYKTKHYQCQLEHLAGSVYLIVFSMDIQFVI